LGGTVGGAAGRAWGRPGRPDWADPAVGLGREKRWGAGAHAHDGGQVGANKEKRGVRACAAHRLVCEGLRRASEMPGLSGPRAGRGARGGRGERGRGERGRGEGGRGERPSP